MIIIARTKTEAIKERKKFDKTIPKHLQTVIIDYSKELPKGSDLRYNYRFFPKEIKLTAKDRIYTDKQATKIFNNYKKRKGIR